jgi:hypothetical protein
MLVNIYAPYYARYLTYDLPECVAFSGIKCFHSNKTGLLGFMTR